MISERRLRQMRKEALKNIKEMKQGIISSIEIKSKYIILELTQELIDQHLLKGK